MKLLFIDSDRHLIEMLTNRLKILGYDVHHAYNEEQAKHMWLEQQPDLVIVDPAISGVNVLATCRDLQSKHDALLMVMTDGRKDIEDEVSYLESGADDYLRKPFPPSQLLAHIHAISRRLCKS